MAQSSQESPLAFVEFLSQRLSAPEHRALELLGRALLDYQPSREYAISVLGTPPAAPTLGELG